MRAKVSTFPSEFLMGSDSWTSEPFLKVKTVNLGFSGAG